MGKRHADGSDTVDQKCSSCPSPELSVKLVRRVDTGNRKYPGWSWLVLVVYRLHGCVHSRRISWNECLGSRGDTGPHRMQMVVPVHASRQDLGILGSGLETPADAVACCCMTHLQAVHMARGRPLEDHGDAHEALWRPGQSSTNNCKFSRDATATGVKALCTAASPTHNRGGSDRLGWVPRYPGTSVL